MSIGDSLLDNYSYEDILKNIEKDVYNANKVYFKNKNLYLLTFVNKLKLYSEVQVYIKREDYRFIIQAIDGLISYRNNIDSCEKQMIKITNEFSNIFINSNKQKIAPFEHNLDSASIVWGYEFPLSLKGRADITCTDWSDTWTKEKGWYDSLRVGIMTNEIAKLFNY